MPRAPDLMDREHTTPLNAPATAHTALMSPSHLSRQFHAAYGETPYSYLITRPEISRSLGLALLVRRAGPRALPAKRRRVRLGTGIGDS